MNIIVQIQEYLNYKFDIERASLNAITETRCSILTRFKDSIARLKYQYKNQVLPNILSKVTIE